MTTVDPETLFTGLENLKSAQPVFRATGGAHAAALVQSGGALIEVYEDIGRHNAIDKTIGAALLSGRESFSDLVLLTTGRAAFETLQKAYMAGIGIVAAVGPASSLAVALGREANIAVVGFLKPDGFNRYQ